MILVAFVGCDHCPVSDDLHCGSYVCLITHPFGHLQDKPGKHLPYDSPKLQRVRDYVQWAVAEGGVHERLIRNFDQAQPEIV